MSIQEVILDKIERIADTALYLSYFAPYQKSLSEYYEPLLLFELTLNTRHSGEIHQYNQQRLHP